MQKSASREVNRF